MISGMRPIHLAKPEVEIEHRPDGTILAVSPARLPEYPGRVTDRLGVWAKAAPERLFLADRGQDGCWRRLTYAETWGKVRAMARALRSRPLSAQRPILILSGNDLEHALLGLAAMYAGIPYAPISPAYTLASSDHGKLRSIIALLTPGMVFAADGDTFGPVIQGLLPSGVEVVTVTGGEAMGATPFDSLLRQGPDEETDAANLRIGQDSIAKFLFTSGSTGLPKAVVNTHRMMCANQEMLRNQMLFLGDEPPVLLDWLPWNHTAGGNNDFGIALYNGGTIYIDDGRPTPAGILATVRNLHDVSPTLFFNVPKGYEALIPHLRDDPALCLNFFRNLRAMHYAGAGLSTATWQALQDLAKDSVGQSIPMLTGLGCTESAPSALASQADAPRPGMVGLPLPGVSLKLVPTEDRYEVRLKGPNLTPGYWRQPDLTAAAFDSEGYYLLGDALRFADPNRPEAGFVFDGRLAEDFKLSTGTKVAAGALRARLIQHFAPYVSDVVVAGHDRDYLAVILFPDLPHCRDLAPEEAIGEDWAKAATSPRIRSHFASRLENLACELTGSSSRIERVVIADHPPSPDAHEITDKGSLNQRAVLVRRAETVAALYAEPPPPQVITLQKRN